MDNPFQLPAVISFCSGIRVLDRGLERAIGPLRTIAYVEGEAFCAWNLVAQMEAGLLAPAPVYTDVKTFPAKIFRNRIHGITAGYPCQGESLAGKRQMQNDPRWLWNDIARTIKTIKPLWGFFENVDDHLSGSFPIVLESLRAMGYAVEAGIFSAREVGLPHERKRLFVLALSNSYYQWQQQQKRNIEKSRRRVGDNSKELEHASNIRRGRFSPIGKTNSGNKNEYRFGLHESARASSLPGNESLAEELANNNKRKQIPIGGRFATKQVALSVAPPGSDQFEWEEPRTIEPRLGCAINGY